ncbi:hypothetical protein, unknown function [Leishmania mexicana MHOM/GT/2001/U1103]|uniref:Uncharacterized protein n=1 Tax=Leishmania mexicana (strain MHOM/GT/2001/U1103) TaxID=929439 RepID=E9B4M1_LEIMU|nr:hypothetical protein, unknown function [Leishmania mexicana MHOM/GT/2001/U1103]CBZ30190.1 hypothetical protein, unknown function [Leishmania mexicana MHOM/GT/2001/U1103]
MRRYQHLRDVHPRPYTNGHERGCEVGLAGGCQRDGGHQCSGSAQSSCRSSGGSEDEARRRCDAAMVAAAPTPRRALDTSKRAENPRGVTGALLSPHVSFSPISFHSAQASAITYGAAETTKATVSSASAPKAFYDGPSLRDSIPALLARLTNPVTLSPSRAPKSTRLFELAAKEDTLKRDVASLPAHPIVVPRWSSSRQSDVSGGAVATATATAGQRKAMKAEASNRSLGSSSDEILQGTTPPKQTQVGRYEVRQPNAKGTMNRGMIARAEVQSAYTDAPPSAATVFSENTKQRPMPTPPARYVVVQRSATSHVLPHASEAATRRNAATVAPESAARHSAELTPRCCSVASPHGIAEGTGDVCSSSVASTNTSLSRPASRRPRAWTRRRRPSRSDSAEAVAERKREIGPVAAAVAATREPLLEASKEALGTASDQAPPPRIMPSSSMNSASDVTQKRASPSQIRGLFDFVLSNSGNSGAGVEHTSLNTSGEWAKTSPECADGVSSHAADLPPREQRRSHTIASPFLLLKPMGGVFAPSHGALYRDESVAPVDSLVLRHTIDYLLSKARRLEKENQHLWWQVHSWNPHRALEPHEAHPVAVPLAHRRVRNSSLAAEAVTRTPHTIPFRTVASTQIQHPPESQSRVFVKRQPRLSQAVGRSASCTSTSFLSQESPRCSGSGEGDGAAEEHASANPGAPLCTAAADTPIPPSTESAETTATSAVSRTEVGVQCRPAARDAATDARAHRSPGHLRLASMAEAPGPATEALRSVSSSPHADASAQTELVAPSPSALLRTLEARHQALHHRWQGTANGDGRGVAAATPITSTARSRHSIDSECSLSAMATDATPLLSFSVQRQQGRSISNCSSPAHVRGTSQASASSAPRGRYPTYSKQVQTARTQLPSLGEVEDVGGRGGGGDALMVSAVDRTASVLSSERTAVIELHTSASYTRNTVRRLREYCNSLEATRQQLRRRLSKSVTNTHDVSPVALPRARSPSSLSHSNGRAPLHPPATATSTLSRPFFISEYVDPEVDATLQDVEETTALETMIVLHEDGAGTITKRMIDGSQSCISSFAVHSPSPKSQRLPATMTSSLASQSQTPVAERVASWVRRYSPRAPRRMKPQQLLSHYLRDTHDTAVIAEEPYARRHSPSLRTDGSSSCCVPVVQLGKPMRSASASSWNASDVNIHFPDAVPLASSLSKSPPKESPSIERFVVQPTTLFEEGDAEQLPPQPLPPRTHNHQTKAGASALVSLAGCTASGQFAGLQTGVTSSTRRASGRVNSQRFAVKGVRESLSPKEHSTRSLSKSSRSSAGPEALISGKETTSSASAAAASAPLWDPTRHSLQSPSPVMLSTSTETSAAAALVVSDRFGMPVITSGSEAGVRGASNDRVHCSRPIATSLITAVASASLSSLSAPAPDSEVPLTPAETPVQPQIRSPLRRLHLEAHTVRCDHGDPSNQRALYKDSLHVSGSASPAPSTPRDPEEDSGDRCKRSNTRAFLDEEKREASAVSSAGACRVSVQLPVLENDVVSPDGADSFHSRDAAVSPRSSAERVVNFLLPAQVEGSLLLQSQRPTPQRLISPSPPREAAADENAQNPGDSNTDLKAIPAESIPKDAGIDSTSPRRHLVVPQHRPPVAPPRVIVIPKNDESPSPEHSSLSRSLHSLPSTLSDEHCDDASDDGDDEGGALWYSERF